ncbi:MAG: DUF2961 domain-containing protein [Fimbriimonadaceae bacterium]|nr:DUF2961 domain-containing protein [Fimbriimonadaceae bacterium]
MTLLPLLIAAIAPQVSVESLLPEMTDLHRLYLPPSPAYTCSQASSYDRRSKTPGNADWFANGDAGHFLRDEHVDGRVEHVMADLKGPGAVVRVWSANPAGVVRFYFDGESTPRLTEKLADLLSEKHAPFGYGAANGWDLYFPVPYAKSLKITVDNSDERSKSLYYHVNYRSYTSPVNVTTFTTDAMAKAQHGAAAAVFTKLDPVRGGTKEMGKQMRLAPGGSSTLTAIGHGVVEDLTLMVPPKWATAEAGPANAQLRDLELQIDFDGEACVRVPVSDFFGCAPGLSKYDTMVTHVENAGRLTSRWKMPYAKRAVFRLVNHAKSAVTVDLTARISPERVREPFYRFHAQWFADDAGTRPFRDLLFLDAKGQGRYVGTGLQVGNSNPDWWGEGDEKVWVDGESFPSTFGTGTEDYFGYAWSTPKVFQKPYHAQPRADGPGCGGQISNLRWHIIDSIPFTKSLKFVIEAWHWRADSACSWAGTSFWYGSAGSSPARPVDTAMLQPVEYVAPKPVPGAIEGEKMKVLEHVGGDLTIQGGFPSISNGSQLWWQDPKPGDHITLELPVAKDGVYELVGSFCHANDYGVHHLYLDDTDLGEHDFYGAFGWRVVSLGSHRLSAGNHRFRAVFVRDNPKAEPKRHMLGIDYLKLKS